MVFHGLFGMLDNWGTFGREMSEYMPVHLVELRNHGRSFHSEEMSIKLMTDDILRYLQHYNIEKAYILGHSLGGKVVMQFAMDHPDKVEKLVVADMGPKAYPPHHQGIFKGLNSVDFSTNPSRSEVDEQLKKYIPEVSVRQFLTKNLYWNSDKRLTWRFNLPVLSKTYNEVVTRAVSFGRYSGPTLFLAGGNSNYVLPQDELVIKQRFPKAEIKRIKGAGHWLHAEKPQEFFNEVFQFLQA